MGTCCYVGVLFFLEKGRIIGIRFQIWAELWLTFEEACRTMGTILGKVAKVAKKSKGSATVV